MTQIESSASQTEASLEAAMATVLQQVTAALNERKAQLMKEVSDVKRTALQQAETCRWGCVCLCVSVYVFVCFYNMY